jgi:hypothetical protein
MLGNSYEEINDFLETTIRRSIMALKSMEPLVTTLNGKTSFLSGQQAKCEEAIELIRSCLCLPVDMIPNCLAYRKETPEALIETFLLHYAYFSEETRTLVEMQQRRNTYSWWYRFVAWISVFRLS